MQTNKNKLAHTTSVRMWSVAPFLCVALVLTGCSRQDKAPEPVRSVKLVSVGASTAGSGQEYAGEVRAQVESRLGFQVAGKLLSRKVQLGKRVRKGQVLAEVDPQDYLLAAGAAQAQLRSAQAQLDVSKADFDRFESLFRQGFISQAELERRRAALTAAQSQWEQARSQAQVQGHQAGYARLLASHDGVVTAVEAEEGQVVTAGQAIVRVAQLGAQDVVFAVPEQTISGVKLGQTMQVLWPAGQQQWAAKVREVAASADPATRTFIVKLALPKNAVVPLGSTVHVLASGSQATTQALTLPLTALRQQGQGSAVWVLDEAAMVVRSQAVKPGAVQGNDVQILEGLKTGQKVVVAGVHVLTEGQKVSIYVSPTEKAGQ
ncbi:MAG: Multidrug resistance protein MdtA precursor [Pseudomonadota bacterium]|jgi:RND family efflux transporter MFP subunit